MKALKERWLPIRPLFRVIFCDGNKPSLLAKLVKEVRALAVQEGREVTDINFFPNIAPIVGRTLEQAQQNMPSLWNTPIGKVDWPVSAALRA